MVFDLPAPHLLALRGGALGDFVATFPALMAFRSRLPGLPLHLITRPEYGPLAKHLGMAESWSSLYAPEMLAWEQENFTPPLTLAFPVPHPAMLAWLPTSSGPFAENLQRLFSAEIRHSVVPADCPVPAWQFFLGNDALPPLTKPPAGEKRLVIHPGSGSAQKNYPLESWQQAISKLPTTLPISIVLGETEEQPSSAIPAWAAAVANQRPHTEIWRHLSLVSLAQHLQSATHFWGNDSGVGHLAAWLGLQTTIIFGPSNPEIWAPFFKHPGAKVLVNPDPEEICVGF